MKIGEAIRKERTKKRISAYKISKSTGISLAYLSELENGKADNPTINILRKICDTIGISVDELLAKVDFEAQGREGKQC